MTWRAALIACSAIACGPRSATTPTGAPPLEIRRYAPLTMQTDANAPHHAVLLGTDGDGGSTLLPLAATPGPVKIGGCEVVVVRATPGAPTVDPSTAAGWLAARVVGDALNKNLTDYAFHARCMGAAPSAMQLAIGFIASMVHAEVRANATASDALGPDGTNLYPAYARVTGMTLPTASPVTATDMQLDAPVTDALAITYQRWQQRLAIEWAAILQLESAGRLPDSLVALRDDATQATARAEALRKQGQLAAANAYERRAWTAAASANKIYDVLSLVRMGKLTEATAALGAIDTVGPQASSLLDRIGSRHPGALAGQLQMVAAARAALRATAEHAIAVRGTPAAAQLLASLASAAPDELVDNATAEHVATSIVPILVATARARAELWTADDALELPSADIAYSANDDTLSREAIVLRDAATAQLTPTAALAHEVLALERRSPTSVALAVADVAEDLAARDQAARVTELEPLLAAAEQNARAHARAARVAIGSIPLAAKLAFAAATAERTGSLAEQRDALADFWAASAAAREAVRFARNRP